MHDPSFLAFTIPAPWLRVDTWRYPTAPHWGVKVVRRTNTENLGERVYAWWKPKGYETWVASRRLRFCTLVDVWHDEPGGRDSGTVCKDWHHRNVRWAIRHRKHLRWKLIPWFRIKCRFQRCDECHRRMWKATRFGTGWDAPGVLHSECHALRHIKAQRLDLLKHIAGVADWTESWRATRQVDAWLGMAEIEVDK